MILYYAVKFARRNACVAQLAEQLTRNEQVAGSNPATSSKKNTTPWVVSFLLLRAATSRPYKSSGKPPMIS